MAGNRRTEAGPGLDLLGRKATSARAATTKAPRTSAAGGEAAGWDRRALLERLRSKIRTKHLSPRTEETYLRWARRYLGYYGRKHPAAMGRVEIEAFVRHLAEEQGLGPDSQNQAASAVASCTGRSSADGGGP